MKTLDIELKNYQQDPCHFFGFDRFPDMPEDLILSNGIYDFKQLSISQKGKLVHIELEEPNRFLNNFTGFDDYEDYFRKVLTICPYSAKWQNEKNRNNKRQAVFFPFNNDYTPGDTYKKYDIVYTGHLVSNELKRYMETMKKFNYRLVSGSQDPLVTDQNASYQDKLRIISESKITLSHGLLFINNRHALDVMKIKGHRDNEAFKNVSWKNLIKSLLLKSPITVPQIKSRVFEAAFCKSLILHRKDDFNVIERFFEPDKEFIYFTPDTLEIKIKEILGNYNKYQGIVDNAYKKAIKNYTSENFFNSYLKNIG